MTLEISPETKFMSPRDLVCSCTSTDGFGGIRAQGCGAVIMHRDPSAAALERLAGLSDAQLPCDRGVLRPDAIRAHVLSLMPVVDAVDVASRDWLVEDIAKLATGFAALMEAPYIRLRLDVIKTNACRRFHIDAVTARLVCTYRGQTTQYGYAAPNTEPEEIHSVPQACPVILRGTKWADDAPTGLRHRSPPIEGTGETRLLLVLDPMGTQDDDII